MTDEEKFYWFGFLLTKMKPIVKYEWVNHQKHYYTKRITVKVPVKYCEHLTKLGTLLDEPVKASCRLTIHSADFIQLLQDNNITTAAVSPLKQFPADAQRDFWRGYFDAKGNFYKNFKFSISGSYEICAKFLGFLAENHIKTTAKPVKYTNNSYRVNTSGKTVTLKLFNLLYKDATVYFDKNYNFYSD